MANDDDDVEDTNSSKSPEKTNDVKEESVAKQKDDTASCGGDKEDDMPLAAQDPAERGVEETKNREEENPEEKEKDTESDPSKDDDKEEPAPTNSEKEPEENVKDNIVDEKGQTNDNEVPNAEESSIVVEEDNKGEQEPATTNDNDAGERSAEPSSNKDKAGKGDAKAKSSEEIEDDSAAEPIEETAKASDGVSKTAPSDPNNAITSEDAVVEVPSDDTMDLETSNDDGALSSSKAEDNPNSPTDPKSSAANASGGRRRPVVMIDLDCDGEDIYKAFKRKPSKQQKKKKPMRILISGMSPSLPATTASAVVASSAKPSSLPPVSRAVSSQVTDDSSLEEAFSFDATEAEVELAESLKFFEQPHEDQDPDFTNFQEKERKAKIEAELQKLKAAEEAGKREIEIVVSQQLKEKQMSTEKSVERYKLKTSAEEKNELTRLQQSYDEKCRSNQAKIDQGVVVLTKRHAAETEKVLHQHRLQLQHRQISQEQANAQWAQLSDRLKGKQQRFMAEFAAKGDQVKQKCLADLKNETAKVKQVYEKKRQDLDANRHAIYTKIHTGFQQVRQRYLKRHSQAIAVKREALLEKIEDSSLKEEHSYPTRDKKKSISEEKLYMRLPSPIKSRGQWFGDSPYEAAGASSRHKHRKAVLSLINKQLSVEIHNEGIWISQLKAEDSDKSKKKDDSSSQDKKHFIPWGVKARRVLESIICGEIPVDCGIEQFDFGDTVSSNGGHLRCVMTDLRTSDDSAALQRVEAILQQDRNEASKLESRMRELQSNVLATENGIEQITKSMKDLEVKLSENSKEVEKTKTHFQAFRNKFSKYFGPDGKILSSTSPSDQQKLNQALMKWRSALDNGQRRDRAIREKIAEAKGILQKKQGQVNQAQRTLRAMAADVKKRRSLVEDIRSGRAKPWDSHLGNSVSHNFDLLDTTAELRREELNTKRNSSTSNAWVQSLPPISGSLKRSFWYKMHRRRQQIVLRPTFSTLLDDLHKHVDQTLSARGVPQDVIDAELIRAEQKYLLATHPITPKGETISSSPSSTNWAEPGWYLNLDVPKTDKTAGILPRSPSFPLLQENLSELCSAPGRQAACLVRSTHLRSLEIPLSAIGTATSLAERNPSMITKGPKVLNDPLRMTPDEKKAAYNFVVVKTPVPKPVIQRRKSASSKDASPSPAKATKRKSVSTAKSDQGPKTTTTRKRKSTTQTESPSSRTVQRRKSDIAKQKQSQPQQKPQVPQPQQAHPQPQPQQMHQQQQPMQQPLQVQIQQQQQQPMQQPQQVQIQQQQQQPMQQPQQVQMQQQQQQQPMQQQQQPMQQPQFPQLNDQAFQPRPIMTQPQQLQQQQQQRQPGPPMQQQMTPQQQGNQYNQFMGAMPSPMGNQQQRSSFSQFPNNPQMNQFRMMQQQQQQQPGQPQMNYGQHPQQGMQQMPPQFFQQMGQPQQQQQYPQQQPMSMPPGHGVVGPPGGAMQMNYPNSGNNNNNNPNARPNMPSAADQNDPLFMLKEM